MAIKGYEWRIGNMKHPGEKKQHGNMNWKAVDEVTTRFYVTNFPPGTTSKELWRLFVNFGKLVDVYIPDQVPKYEKRFAFVRYLGLKNDKEKHEIGSYHVFANVALYGRGVTFKPPQHGPIAKKTDTSKVKKNLQQVFALPDDLLIHIGSQQLKRFVKIKDPNLISNFIQVCSEEGFDVGVNYIGGRWIIIEFPTISAVEGFEKNAAIRNMIMEVKEITEEFMVDERLIWAEIRGLPACAWADKAIIMLAEKWGEFLFWEESAHNIRWRVERLLEETCKVKIKDRIYQVFIKEIQEWEAHMREENSSNDGQEDGEDDETENGSEKYEEEEEEGEINNNFNLENECNNINSGSNHEEQGPEDNQESTNGVIGNLISRKKNKAKKTNRGGSGGSKGNVFRDLFGSNTNDEGVNKVGENSVHGESSVHSTNSVSKPWPYERKKDSQKSNEVGGEGHGHHSNESEGTRSRSHNGSRGKSKEFEEEELDRLVELGILLGVKMGSKEEIQKVLKKKRKWVRDLCNSYHVMFLSLQETRMTQVDLFKVRNLWGNQNFQFASSGARGRSGVWDPMAFQGGNIVSTDNFLVVKGRWVRSDCECYMVNVYCNIPNFRIN
ncbi:hypothetical protein LXL04_026379 [Taraxacum kok-saghyz]